jgi:hypothetical protein
MACNGDVIDIVHRRSANPSIIPLEPQRLDQVHSRAEAGAQPQNGADISGNLRFE